MSGLELWGGVECTINRVRDTWHDQLAANGHRDRLDDLDLFAALGIRRLRQPVLWERHADGGGWHQPDAALAKLRELGVAPIVGLIHHGSGPAGTSLIDDSFVPGLVAHAARVAARYPWVDSYTPVNEPLTTARFSGLYGLWYPHGRSDKVFARAMLNQCRATVLAMREIRAINPAAKLVQTEDLGLVQSTWPLAYQAELENERRWLTWDLLCGRIDWQSPIIALLLRAGITRDELQWFADNPCPPDVIGINHYVTSDRYLDHRLDRYPGVAPGGNGRHRYVDLEAVRAMDTPVDGWSRCLDEAWQRYALPVAITEAHLHCTRDEQLRWLASAWTAATSAREAGRDVLAVTAWALLGSRDWNSLLTREAGHYEPGVFDTRDGGRRPTALAGALHVMAGGAQEASHPAADGPGWWHRPERLLHQGGSAGASPSSSPVRRRPRQPLLITGAGGNLGHAFAHICEQRGLEYRLCTRRELDICSGSAVEELLRDVRPWAVVNAAGYVRVDDAEHDQERCYRENAAGPLQLASACAKHGIRLATFSSDLVFDGQSASPYVESSAVAPLNTYGRSKALAEQQVLLSNPEALVIRTSSFFGPWHRHDFLPRALSALHRQERFAAMHDVVASHTYVPDLADTCVDLLIDAEKGIWHLVNPGAMSWHELACTAAGLAGLDIRLLEARSCLDFGLPARRPAFSALGTERGVSLPTLRDALERYVRNARAHWREAA